jgi:NAD(P)-dependent dehydrogenase (short-subunit alcohol dehydrogenase family)
MQVYLRFDLMVIGNMSDSAHSQTSLTRRVALVTGGAKGIGKAISAELTDRGYDVAVAGRDLVSVNRTVAELRANRPGAKIISLSLDVMDTASVERAMSTCIDQLGGLDALINNAGIIARGRAELIEDVTWDQILDTDLSGTFRCARAAFEPLRASKGVIVNITSIAAFVGLSGRLAYTTAKAGMEGLTRTLALEWAPHGIRVNNVAPGWTRTEMISNGIATGQLDEARLTSRIPLGRLADPAEIARGVAFLCSADASYITGHTLVIDGGITINGNS